LRIQMASAFARNRPRTSHHSPAFAPDKPAIQPMTAAFVTQRSVAGFDWPAALPG
jgi:hypothetical protein